MISCLPSGQLSCKYIHKNIKERILILERFHNGGDIIICYTSTFTHFFIVLNIQEYNYSAYKAMDDKLIYVPNDNKQYTLLYIKIIIWKDGY